MRCFRIKHNIENFDELQFEGRDDLVVRDSEGVNFFSGRVANFDDWPKPVCSWLEKDKDKPTFPYLANGALVMSKTTLALCHEVFSHVGDQLDMIVDGEDWMALNVLDICNGLDKNLSVLAPSLGHTKVSKYVIRTARVNENVFKLPETADQEILTYTESDRDPEFQLIRMCEKFDLTGLLFEEIETI